MFRYIKREWLEILSIFIISKIYQFVFVYWGHAVRGPAPTGGWEGVDNWLLNPWTTYDSQWYIEIATKGYREVTATFFPLYPLLLKVCGYSETSRALAGVIISNLAFIFALYVLYRLTRLDFSEETAKTVIWITTFFPTAVFYGAVYTESLFLLLITIAFYAVRQNNWAVAGVTGGLAGFTRNPAPLVFTCLFIEYLHSIKYNFSKIKLQVILWLSLVMAGFLGFHLYLYSSFGDPLLSVTSQKFFYRTPAWPWEAVFHDALYLITGRGGLQTLLNLLTVLSVFYYSIKFIKLFRLSYLLFIVGVITMHLLNPRLTEPHTIGAVRYALVLFPFNQILAIVFNNCRLKLTKYLLVIVYLMISAVYSFWFGQKIIFLG
ncbi:MAG: hypothetical protein AB1500_03945 [Bacillota bacterium]